MKYVVVAVSAALLAGCPRSERVPRSEPVPVPEVVADEVPPITLRDHVRPLGYELELALDPDRPQFNGRVAIELELAARVPVIWLNAEELEIDDARVRDAIVTGVRTPEPGLIGVALATPAGPGRLRLELDFHGTYDDQIGLFRQDHDGDEYVYTDFEPIDARRAFPCFDQPRFKVPWQVSLVITPGLEGLANAPEAGRDTLPDGRVRVRFAETPPLPSYLIAVAVGPFEIVEGTAGSVPVRVITPRGLSERTGPALEAIAGLVPLAEDYVGGGVPFRKLDFVAVPRFDGAMENPGLITVAAPILAPEPPVSIPEARFLAMVIAHEVAHLWFGDLVTPRSFEELWLNEGFATWMADHLLATWKPGWAIAGDRVEAKYDAMLLDVPPRAARQRATSRADLGALFDAIVYKKGGSIVHMLEGMLGEARFQAVVRDYLDRHRHGAVTTSDLGAAIERVAGVDVSALAAGFLDRGGVPVVDVEVACEGGDVTLLLSQTPYAPAGPPVAPWPVPVCVRHPGGRQCTVLAEQSALLRLDTDQCPAWLVPNDDERGYYLYDTTDAGWRALAASGALSDAERAGVVQDLAALLADGRIELGVALDVLAALAPRGGRHAVVASIELLERIHDHLLEPADEAAFAAWARSLYRDLGRDLGLTPEAGDSDDDLLLRPKVIEFLGRYADDPAVVEKARKLAARWLAGEDAIPAGMMTATLAVAADHGDRAFLDRMLDALDDADDEGRTQVLLAALAAVSDPELVAWLIDGGDPRLAGPERLRVLGGLMGHPRNRDRILASLPNDELRSALLTAAMLDLCSADELERAAAGLARLIRGEGRRRRVVAEVGAHVRRCQGLRDHQGPAARERF